MLKFHRNPALFTMPHDQMMKTIPMWTKQVGPDATVLIFTLLCKLQSSTTELCFSKKRTLLLLPQINALTRNGKLGYADAEQIRENAASWSQLLGHHEVSMYYLARAPKLLALNQQQRKNLWQVLRGREIDLPSIFSSYRGYGSNYTMNSTY